MADELTAAGVRRVVGGQLADADVEALLRAYATLSEAVAAFPQHETRRVEPALRSIPGPERSIPGPGPA